MKSFLTCTLAATLVAGTAADHAHHHHHGRRGASKVAKRNPDPAYEVVVAATETVYELDGKVVSAEEAKNGLSGGDYVIVGESTPTYVAPVVTSTSAAATYGAQFIESETSSSTTPVPTTTSTTSTTSAAATSSAAATKSSSSSGSSSSSSGTGVSKTFKSGSIKCSEFPSDYGAIAIDYLGFGGWSGIQRTPNYSLGDLTISLIETAISGESCTKNSFCSYACPVGYQKTQWPSAQGSTKESIGGLYCNSDGYLELTRDGYDTLCELGSGGVTIKNELSEGVATCRTDYPGTENMVIPAYAAAGSTINVCNPNQASYYQWNGSGTSAQYYVNKAGYSQENACCWTSSIDSLGAGNWAPIVLGVGESDGVTYISIFPNTPTSKATLDFSIEITGGTVECYFKNGEWSGGSTTGCTTAVSSGKNAVVRYFANTN